MRLLKLENKACRLCGNRHDVKRIDWEADIYPLPICRRCRESLRKMLESEPTPVDLADEPSLPMAAQKIADEAATMTEREFLEKHLTDDVDRVIYGYVRGYGQLALDSETLTTLSLILDNANAETLTKHLASLLDRGLLYVVPGKSGWVAADYPFKS